MSSSLPPGAALQVDTLLIGHGLAGAILAHTLHRAGQRVLVLDAPGQPDTASRVAAGLVNPLAGRRFALTWRADELLPAAAAFYRSVEGELNFQCWHESPIYKLFASAQEANAGAGKAADDRSAFVAGLLPPVTQPDSPVRAPLGGLHLAGGGFLRTEAFLDTLAAARARLGQWRSEAFVPARLRVALADATYELADGTRVEARRVIFCEGPAVRVNPWFGWLPVVPNAGEVLDVDLPLPAAGGPAIDAILNGAVYVVPHGAGRWRVGATYARLSADEVPAPATPTPAGRAELLTRLARVVNAPATVLAHRAGLRPTVPDRRPLVGPHPRYPSLWVFNGLGSKGVGTAPALAAHLARVLAGAEALWPEVAISRYAAQLPEDG